MYSTLCQGFQLCSIAANERQFLGVCPSLDLMFAGNRGDFCGVRFFVDQDDREKTGGPECSFSFVVDVEAFLEIGGVADVEAVVGAAEDVDPESVFRIRQ